MKKLAILLTLLMCVSLSAQTPVYGGSGGSGSGTVNSGSASQVAYYPSDGTAVNGLSSIDTNGSPAGQGAWNRRGVVVYPDFTMTNPYTAAEPTVIVEGNPVVLTFYSTVFKMWWSCGTSICYSESPDGVNGWTRYTGGGGTQGSLISGYSQSNVIKNGSTYYLFANNRSTGIDLYTSTNGVTFTLVQANVITGVNNSGGIFQLGTLYLFAEQIGSGGTHLYTATTPFTTFVDQGKIATGVTGVVRGPSAPYQLNGKWYLWVHVDLSGYTSFSASVIERLSASSLSGTWTNSETGADLIPNTVDELGGTANSAQVADPYVLESGGKTYLYYTASYADATRVYQHIKLAIADEPMATVANTNGGDKLGTKDNLNPLGVWPDPTTFSLDFKDQAITNVRSVTTAVGGTGTFSGGVISGCTATSGCGSSNSRITINGNAGSGAYTSSIIADFVNGGLTFTCPRTFAGKGFAFQNNAGTTTNVTFDCTAPANSFQLLANGTAQHAYISSWSSQTAIASATTIAPTKQFFHVTGTTAIDTITAPSACTVANTSCQITIIPDGLFTTTTAGNIALASTAVVSKPLTLTYDPATLKWYPSY